MKNYLFKIVFSVFLMTTVNSFSQNVTGIVTSNSGPLPGVNINVKGTNVQATTDFDGKFTIKFDASSGVLLFNYVGFDSRELTVTQNQNVKIIMVENINSLDQVVVVGYGQTQNKKKISTAVGSISSSQIVELAVARPEAALQGTTPGVTVVQTSGSPGAPLTVRLRGAASIGASSPLYLVDGQQVPNIGFINPDDIKSMNILKDAASSAIYGARGGNGVILVETKTGRRNSAKPTITIDTYTGFQSLGNKPDLMDKDAYVTYLNDFRTKNPGNGTPLTPAEISKLPNTDWYDEVFKTTPMTSLSSSVSGGGENYSYSLSGGIFDQKGMVGGNEGKSGYQRKNMKLNFETDITSNFNLDMGVNLVSVERDYLFENQSGTGVSIMNFVNSIPSIYPTHDPNDASVPFGMGNQNGVVVNGVPLPSVGAVANPFLALIITNNKTISDITNANIKGTWKVAKDLKIAGTFYHYKENAFDKQFTPSFDYSSQQYVNVNATLRETRYENKLTQFDANAAYKFSNLGDHHLDLLAGMSVYESSFGTSSQNGVGFFTNDFDSTNFGTIRNTSGITSAVPYAFDTALVGYYGKVNYDYANKYLLTGTLRADSSSNFGANNRTGVFPSFSGGWVMSEESFLKNVEAIDLLKFRASWGINGSDNINPFQYSTVLNTGSGTNFGGNNVPGLTPAFLPNPNVKWEEVSQTNFGLDINAFDNSFGITFDYYIKKTSDMLIPIGVPLLSGYPAPATNIADMENRGFELLLSYRKTYTNGFSWDISANLAKNNNEVTSLGNNGQPLVGGTGTFIFNDPITLTTEGHSIAGFYGYQVDHKDADGKLVYKDTDGVPGITTADKTYIGSALPDFTYGLNLGAAYKNFDFNAFLYGSEGNDIFDATVRTDAGYTNRKSSYSSNGVVNTLGFGLTDSQVSDFYVKDGSFLKLKTVSIGYSLPSSLIDKLKMSKLRLYVTGQNLWVSTKYDGADPEIGESGANNSLDMGIDRGFYPQARTILMGLQVKF
jgi:TonB-dependent starch-binding outer membrane protein SusC